MSYDDDSGYTTLSRPAAEVPYSGLFDKSSRTATDPEVITKRTLKLGSGRVMEVLGNQLSLYEEDTALALYSMAVHAADNPPPDVCSLEAPQPEYDPAISAYLSNSLRMRVNTRHIDDYLGLAKGEYSDTLRTASIWRLGRTQFYIHNEFSRQHSPSNLIDVEQFRQGNPAGTASWFIVTFPPATQALLQVSMLIDITLRNQLSSLGKIFQRELVCNGFSAVDSLVLAKVPEERVSWLIPDLMKKTGTKGHVQTFCTALKGQLEIMKAGNLITGWEFREPHDGSAQLDVF